MSLVQMHEEWVLGPGDTPFYTREWSPKDTEPIAHVLFVHGFSEHITRYQTFFSDLIAVCPVHITAFDQRGHGKTAHEPHALTAESDEVMRWKSEGKRVNLAGKHAKRVTGGWAKVMPDIEWFVQRESERAKARNKKLFLWGFSMGGGEVLAFVTRPQAPPSPETVSSLSGVIAGGSLITLSNSAPAWQLKAGTVAASLGLGSVVIPTPMKVEDLSHNVESNAAYKDDPMCEAVGTLRGVSDMILGGTALNTPKTWDRWPKGLPLLVYHGQEDKVCDCKAAEKFVDNVRAEDKSIEIIPGMYHEVHNEPEPVPSDLIKRISEWLQARIDRGSVSAIAETTEAQSSAKL